MIQNEAGAGLTVQKLKFCAPHNCSKPALEFQQIRSGRECHHANHALFYLSMLVESALRGKMAMANAEKVKRIKEHMLNLCEFVGPGKTLLLQVIHELLKKLDAFRPIQRRQFLLFVYENWGLIRSFAAAYGHDERCFSAKHYEKIRDRVRHRHYLRLWWWKRAAIKMHLRICRRCQRLKDWILWD
jgi:hypothetical protein